MALSYHRLHDDDVLVPVDKTIPRLSVTLKSSESNQNQEPIFSQGDVVSGTLTIDTPCPLQVDHLRIVFYGSAQVHGQDCDHALPIGIFDYLIHKPVINTGMRIVKKSSSVPTALERNSDEQKRLSVSHDDKHYHQLTITGSETGKGEERHEEAPVMLGKHPLQKPKTAFHKKIESLLRQVASSDSVTGSALACYENDSTCFELNAATHHIPFSLRIPSHRRLASSFDHPNFPIQYQVVALLLCKDKSTGIDRIVYAKAPMKLVSTVCVDDVGDNGTVQGPWFAFSGTALLSRRQVKIKCKNDDVLLSPPNVRYTSWLKRFLCATGFLLDHRKWFQCCAQLAKPAFLRGSFIDLRIHLINGMARTLSSVGVHVQLVKRILMTAGISETAETTTVCVSDVVFQNDTVSDMDKNQSVLDYRQLIFDYNHLLQVPHDCPCTIPSSDTRHVFELRYELWISLEVRESTDRTPRPLNYSQTHTLVANDFAKAMVSLDNREGRVHHVHLPPVGVTIGNA
ncbi:uncharacterized protein BYT42DRAFT_573278 [Radiomyces spectabilis]|uniref:uncharacterized protein n=1 Tax=Radiomyces spectabilis TaxID=64574 RepID=UPI00221F96B0|nr:uncharacterized protein BYT42DRAFT_573278 [Radiomyces spectabilis]KAI8376058.1 hypothetical protein BYT42DRAFT_573278 [Radiomyces spectabilis]